MGPAGTVAAGASDSEASWEEEGGGVRVEDDLDALLEVLPEDIREQLAQHPKRAQLLEVVMDLGRSPEARFLGQAGGDVLRADPVSRSDLAAAEAALGEFGGDNRAGLEGTLHRVSAIRNRRGRVVGLTCRVGRAVSGHVEMIRDLVEGERPQSILFLGRPGVGKTTVIREISRVLADELHRRVVVVDTSNEIGGDGDVPHPAIGGARRMQVPDPAQQHRVMVEAVENHMPEFVIIDEIGSEAEALACRTIAERGVVLIGTAHGQVLENVMKNPSLSDLVGGIQTVTLGDDEARLRGTKKSVQERKAPPTFPLLVEIRERSQWVAHWTEDSVDALLRGQQATVQARTRNPETQEVLTSIETYVSLEEGQTLPGRADLPGKPNLGLFAGELEGVGSTPRARAGAGAPESDWSEPPAPGLPRVGDSQSSGLDMAERLRDISESGGELEALQELATMGYIGGSSSAQRRNGMTSFSGKVPPGKGRKGRKNTAQGTPRRPPPIGS